MRRIDVYLDESWISYLKKLPGTFSEHIRQAVNNYMIYLENAKISASLSKKGGGEDGQKTSQSN